VRRPTRRQVLIAGAAVGGGLAVGLCAGVGGGAVALSRHDRRAHMAADADGELVALWIQIRPDGTVVVLSPHTEMGQGAHTGLAQIVAEELDVPWEGVEVVQAPAEKGFSNGNVIQGFVLGDRKLSGFFQRVVENAFFIGGDLMNLQMTGGSTSVRFTGWKSMRVAAAAARQMLLVAAAGALDVDVLELEAVDGVVTHAPSGRSMSYGALAPLAATLPVPQDPPLKDPSAWRHVGRSLERRDLVGKVFGATEYGIDRHLPGLRYAAVKPTRQIHGEVLSVDNEAEVLARRGVQSVTIVQNGVAVVADNPWRAQQAADAVVFTEREGPHAHHDTASLRAMQQAALDDPERLSVVVERGSAEGHEGRVVEASYFVPFLAHAPMEPLNATVWRGEDGRVNVAVGVQDPLLARTWVADALGVELEQVVLHPHPMGGGFGRRAPAGDDMNNYLRQALTAWQASGEPPLKLTWSREVDIRQDRYRKQAIARYRGVLGPDGRPTLWQADSYAEINIPDDAVAAYDVPRFLQRTVHEETFVPYAYWRSVEASIHCFFNESFVDELAAAAGADPLQYRLDLLPPGSRLRGVLEKVREMSGWRAGVLADGSALGVAAYHLFGSYCAQVARVSIDGGTPRVHDVWCALDCGVVINPDGVEAQMQGGMIFGLTAALYGAIDIEAGGVVQSNFHDYRMVRLAEAPRLHVALVPSAEEPGGVGEVAVPHLSAAVANAMAVLGSRPRELPIIG
jgi:isoquinoline 1-oxidoreductase beta subunit